MLLGWPKSIYYNFDYWFDHPYHSTGKEDYQELKDCLGQTFDEIDEVKRTGIKIDGEHFDVEWWVFIMTVLFTYLSNLRIHQIKSKYNQKSMWNLHVGIIMYMVAGKIWPLNVSH